MSANFYVQGLILVTTFVGLELAGQEGRPVRQRWGWTIMVFGQVGWIVAMYMAEPLQWGTGIVVVLFTRYWIRLAWRAWRGRRSRPRKSSLDAAVEEARLFREQMERYTATVNAAWTEEDELLETEGLYER